MTIHDTLYLTTFHAFIPPIRSVSACKGCCLAPRNNHGSQNAIKSWRTWKLWKVEYGLYLAAFELNRQQKTGPGSLTIHASSARIASLETRSSRSVFIDWTSTCGETWHSSPSFVSSKSLFTDVWKNAAVRQFFVGPYYIWAYQNWGKWSASKNLEGKKTPVHGKEELEC